MQRLLHNHNKKVKKKQERDLCCFENHATKKNIRAFNVARQRQRSIYQITSPTTCNLHTDKQTNFV